MSDGTRLTRPWVVPAIVGAVAVGLFVVLVTRSATVRAYWPLLLLSAAAAAAPFLFRDASAPARRPLPLRPPDAEDDAVGTFETAPSLLASAISLPKAGAVGGENDDAYGIDADAGYVAIADGASSSFRAGEWATALCTAFLEQRPLGGGASSSWITKAAIGFRAAPGPEGAGWWNADAAERGAHAAFVGLAVLRHEQGLRWRATAVGDSVLVHVRPAPAGQAPIVTAFPIAHSAAFPQNPPLLSSVADTPPPVSSIEGSAAYGDVWLLMTDELARWALRRFEAGEPAWERLARGTEADVAAMVAEARATQVVADDDMTVVRCEVVEAG